MSDFSPDDLAIVQKRQEWRLRVARICIDYFEGCSLESLASAPKSPGEIADLAAAFVRISDYVKRDLSALLVTGVSVHELEVVRCQVNYFLEEVVRHLRTIIQNRVKTRRPLLDASRDEIAQEVWAALSGGTAEALLVFIEDLVKLAHFELEVSSQRERIRLLLGGDRRLSGLGNNETIMTAPLDELWRALDDFIGVYAYLRENLPPLLEKTSPYPALENELRQTDEQLQALIHRRIDPFEDRLTFKRGQDVALRRLERDLDRSWRATTEILELRGAPLKRQASSSRDALITASEVNRLCAALRELAAGLEELPAEVVLPAPKKPLDGRRELRGNDLSALERRLGRVLAETPLLRQTALAGRGERPELPEGPVLEEMLGEAADRLAAVQAALEAALAEVRQVRDAKVQPLREHFCTLMGELRTFLQTSFAHIAAKDPRSTESSYHFFLREFADEAHQAILLLNEIRELEVFIASLGRFTIAGLPLTPDNLARILRVLFIDKADEKKRIPSGEGWKVMSAFLEKLKNDLVPRLQKVCALDGIRYEDKNFLSEWAMDLTRNCTLCLAQHNIGYNLLQEMGRLREDPEQAATRQSYAHIVTARTCRAMQESLTEICITLTASVPYVGIMRDGIERRASVFFHRQQKVLEGDATEEAVRKPPRPEPIGV